MLLHEAEAIHVKPENADRAMVLVREEGDEFVAEWEGSEFRAGNLFGLDSLLSEAGVPRPRNLYLIEKGVE